MSNMFVNVIWLFIISFVAGVTYAASSHRPLRYNISEELPGNTLVGDVRADYAALTSTNVDANYRYSLRSPSRYFRMDGGVMRTNTSLDREAICPSRPPVCELNTDVVLRGRRLVTVIKVIINVVDVNDHAPTFTGLSTIDIRLPVDAKVGALFPLPAADDGDAGPLSVMEYRLDGVFPRDLFTLRVNELIDGSHDVRLRLTAPLDRRRQNVYAMKLIAVDGGGRVGGRARSGSVDITVTVERPVAPVVEFEPTIYTARIAENSPRRHPIVHVKARLRQPDKNSLATVNADIVYSMGDGQTSTLGINSRTGLVYVNDSIDYERNRVLRMTVIAVSSGETIPPSTATASLIVDVTDVNDNKPEITLNALTKSGQPQVVESVDEGTFVAHVAVTDTDSFGDNSRTSCVVVEPSSSPLPLFRLQQLVAGLRPEYKLVTAVSGDHFDRETIDLHHVTIACHDFGTPSLTSSMEVNVNVVDINDNTPQFSNDTYVTWLPFGPTTAGSSQKLLQLVANDSDAGKNAELHYSLQPIDLADSDCVTVNRSTAVVSATVEKCDDDLRPGTELNFVATVTDGGEPARSSTASIIVRVISDADVPRPPRFSNSSYVLAADCDIQPGKRIGTISAFADDPHDDVKLAFQPSTVDFRVDSSSGGVVAASSLLPDTVDATSSVVKTTVLAVVSRPDAPPATSSASVAIHIRCGLPRFVFPNPSNSTIFLSSDAAVEGAVVVLPEVKSRRGSATRFTLMDSKDGMFRMDPLTGLVRLMKTPPAAVYRLTLKVTDDTGVADVGELVVNVEPLNEPSATALTALIATEKAVIVVGMACGAGGLLMAVLAAVVVSLWVRRRRTKRANNYNCRLEAASKVARLSSVVSEVTESSSLRRSTIDNDIDTDCLEISHHHGVDDRTADWVDDVDSPCDGQTRCDAILPPPILKNGVKKEVKFCLDVSDEDGLKRPLNVYQALPETVLFRCPAGRSVSLAAADDDAGDDGSVGSSGSVTDSGRGASEEGDSATTPSSSTTAAAATTPATFTQQCHRQESIETSFDGRVTSSSASDVTLPLSSPLYHSSPATSTVANSNSTVWSPRYHHGPQVPVAMTTFRRDTHVTGHGSRLPDDVSRCVTCAATRYCNCCSSQTPYTYTQRVADV